MRLRARLAKLERSKLLNQSCPACAHRRGLSVLISADEDGQAMVAEADRLPAPCARCGEIPEQIIYVIEVVVPDGHAPPELEAEAEAGTTGP
jgi:hypothetical protein